MSRTYTLHEARQALRALRPALDDMIVVRADLAELTAAMQSGGASPLGGLPELKAAQARFDELLSSVIAADVQVKGVAPLLIDFPAGPDDDHVLWCWLEGDPDLRWYHRADLGFLGRRPVR
jgi:hypothetical protein